MDVNKRLNLFNSILSNHHNYYVELDFSNPDHYEAYMHAHGGEEKFFEKNAHLVETFKYLRSEVKPAKLSVGEDVPVEGFSSLYQLYDLILTPVGELLKGEKNNQIPVQPSINLECKMIDKYESISAVTSLFNVDGDKNIYLGEVYSMAEDTHLLRDTLKFDEGIQIISDDKSYEYLMISTVTTSTKKEDSNLYNLQGYAVANTIFQSINADDMIDSFVLNDPIVKDGHQHEQVFISYTRSGSMRDPDYDIPETPYNLEDGTNVVNVCIPVSTTLTLKPNYYFVKDHSGGLDWERGYQLWITNFQYGDSGQKKDGTIYNYSNIAKIVQTFTKSDKSGNPIELELIFPKYWNTVMPTGVVTYQPYANLDYYLQFTVQITDGKNTYPVTFSVNSDYPIDPKHKYIIKPKKLKIQWGCFAWDTILLMADHSFKQAQDIKIGDKLMDKNGQVQEVKNIYSGPESKVYKIKTKNKEIRVSGGHPFLTFNQETGKDEVIRAYKITKGMILHTVDGLEEVTEICEQDYDNKKVYNFKFASNTFIIGNGFVTGDYAVQNEEVELIEI